MSGLSLFFFEKHLKYAKKSVKMNGKKERKLVKKWRSVHVHVQILAVKVQSSKNERRSRTPVTFSVHRTSLSLTM